MEFEYRGVPLEQIADDTTYRIGLGGASPVLEASLRKLGLINAPILVPAQGRYVVISGFARIATCRKLGWSAVAARCLSADTPHLTCALLAIADNAGQRNLNVVELAKSIALIAETAIDQDEQVALLRSLGISVNKNLVQKLIQIPHMPLGVQTGLAEGTIALPVALRLHELQDRNAAEELSGLFHDFHLGLNRQRELLDWLQAIALRDDTSVSEILNQEPIAAWRGEEKGDRGYTAQLIRRYLRTRRYPEITAFEQHYARCLKKLELPTTIQITPPPHFEGRTYSLRADFRNGPELARSIREIQRIAESPVLNELIPSAIASTGE